MFEFHDAHSVARTAFGSRAVDSNHARQGSFDSLDTVFKAAFYNDAAVFDIKDIFSVCYLRQTEFFSNLRSNLCGVAVNSLSASKNKVYLAHFFDGLGEGVGGGKGVGSAEYSVSENNAAVRTTENSFTDNFACARKTHCEDVDCRAGIGVLDAERLFKGIEILRVEDGGESGAVDSAVLLHCIFAHVAGIGYLLCEHNDV